MMVIFVYDDHCHHLRWSFPPHPYPDKAQIWTCSSRRGSRKWSRPPYNNRTSSRTRSTSPDSFLFLHIVLNLTGSFLIFIWSILTWFNSKNTPFLALVGYYFLGTKKRTLCKGGRGAILIFCLWRKNPPNNIWPLPEVADLDSNIQFPSLFTWCWCI